MPCRIDRANQDWTDKSGKVRKGCVKFDIAFDGGAGKASLNMALVEFSGPLKKKDDDQGGKPLEAAPEAAPPKAKAQAPNAKAKAPASTGSSANGGGSGKAKATAKRARKSGGESDSGSGDGDNNDDGNDNDDDDDEDDDEDDSDDSDDSDDDGGDDDDDEFDNDPRLMEDIDTSNIIQGAFPPSLAWRISDFFSCSCVLRCPLVVIAPRLLPLIACCPPRVA